MNATFDFQVTEHAERLDKFLVTQMTDLSRARVQTLIKEGHVFVNGAVVTKTGFDAGVGSEVRVEVPEPLPTQLQGEDIPLQVVFENDDILVIDKPAGMVVHPALGHATGTLVNAALGYAPEMEGVAGEGRPGVVHRLDKDTSGLILIAKNDRALYWLQEQFKTRQVQKVYLALSDGHPKTPTGRIEAAIGRDPAQRKQMAIVSDAKGRAAVSEYLVMESFAEHTLFEVYPHTGRTHQIRLHLTMIGCPIVGDTLYGHSHPSLKIKRQFLHAARLTVTLPGETEPRTFQSPLPPELQSILDELRSK